MKEVKFYIWRTTLPNREELKRELGGWLFENQDENCFLIIEIDGIEVFHVHVQGKMLANFTRGSMLQIANPLGWIREGQWILEDDGASNAK